MTEAMINILESDSDVSAIVGAKIYPGDAPQDTVLPYVIIEQIGRIPHHTKSGPSELDVGIVNVTNYHNKYYQARDLAEKCKTALHGHASGVESVSGQNIDSVRLDDENEEKIDDNTYEVEQTYNVRRKL